MITDGQPLTVIPCSAMLFMPKKQICAVIAREISFLQLVFAAAQEQLTGKRTCTDPQFSVGLISW